MYKFRRTTEEEKKLRSFGGLILNPPCNGEEDYALFLGKALTVFGKPDYMSEDWESMYSYLITAEDENGGKLILEVYHGPSGAAIGGDYRSESAKGAAQELAKLILEAEPSDYEWESVYEDIPVNVKYIVKDGKVNVESSFPKGFEEMDDEDIEAFM